MSEKTVLMESFIWRFYNTFKVTVFPVIAYVLLQELERVGSIDGLGDLQTWKNVLYAVLVSLLTSALAGTDKVLREKTRLEQ